LFAYDLSASGAAVSCVRIGSGLPGDAPFTLLWFTRGRPGQRYGFAFANNPGPTTPYSPTPELRGSSSGGSITSRRTGSGKFQVVFGALARPAGGTEIVIVSPWVGADMCSADSWGNTASNDLAINVTCWNPGGTPVAGAFTLLVIGSLP
jgi:hypothetical protein